jgi:outer membrane receptor protein involved in Fe transport
MGPRVNAACAVVMLACTGTAVSQETSEEQLLQLYGEKGTISIATGALQPLGRAPAVATVITAEDIRAMGAVDLDEVMETVPGMHVARNYISNTANYVMRGMYDLNNTHILLLQNGIPMTTMFLGNKGGVWGGLPLENIARIEIIRGPGSALYGADAYSGVVNVITKTATETPGTEFGLRAGSFSTWDSWVQHGGKMGPIDVAAYLRLGSTDGFKETVTADAQTQRDTKAGTHASLAPGPMNLGRDAADASLDLAYDKWRLRGGYKLRDNVGLGAGVASALDPTSVGRSERTTADLSWVEPNVGPGWGLGFTGAYLQYIDTTPGNLLLSPPGSRVAGAYFPNGLIGGPNKWERQFRLSGYATYSGIADHRVRLGGGHEDLNVYRTATYKNYLINQATGAYTYMGAVSDYSEIQPFMRPQRRFVNYAYAQDEWNFMPDWTLTAGIRHDAYSDVGGTTNPRLALVWEAGFDMTVKLLAGRAFRAPSFNELYGINNPVNKGNPDLRPETNQTQEAAISWQVRQDLHLNANIFTYRMRDVIRAVANANGPAGFTTFQNTGDQKGVGGELEAVWDASRALRLTANYSRQRSIDLATDTDVGYDPHDHVYARGDWRFMSGLLASMQANWVGVRKRASGDTRPDLGGYTTVDVTLRTAREKASWEFSGSIRNLFNRQVYEPSLFPVQIPNDLPQAPRSFYLQAMCSL